MRLTAKTFAVMLTVLLLIAFMPLLSGGKAYAQEIPCNYDSFTFDDAENAQYFVGFWPASGYDDSDHEVVSATSSDTTILKLESLDTAAAYFEPVRKAGSCTVKITFANGDTATIPVTVKKSWYKWYLKKSTEVVRLYYGFKTIKINSLPGTTGTVKVGKKTYKFKVNSKGKATVKVKKLYKLKTKFKFTFKNTKLAGKPSFKKTKKMTSITSFYTAERLADKKIEVDIAYLTVGDKVKLTYKGKTYTIKITKKNKKGHLKFKLKNKIPKKDTDFKVKVINKYKQVVMKQTFTLYDGITAEPPDDPDSEGDDPADDEGGEE